MLSRRKKVTGHITRTITHVNEKHIETVPCQTEQRDNLLILTFEGTPGP